MKNKTAKSGSGALKIAALGASLAGLAATVYFLFGPKSKERQKHAKAWAIKMKGDVIEKLEAAGEISESVYHKIIDSVAEQYGKGNKASRKDISAVARDLKKHWQTISASAVAVKSKAVKSGVTKRKRK
ncbi:MAG: hypothetical protein PHF50_02630 [Patescibacteria group bacterium]|nr:hypothetical protein [Patescibacteria group bacterium]